MNTATLERASLLRRLADAQQDGSRCRAGERAQGSGYGFGSALHAAAKRSGVTDDDVDALLAALASWQEFQRTGMHATLGEVAAWMRSWSTDEELPMPCHSR